MNTKTTIKINTFKEKLKCVSEALYNYAVARNAKINFNIVEYLERKGIKLNAVQIAAIVAYEKRKIDKSFAVLIIGNEFMREIGILQEDIIKSILDWEE